MFSASLVCLLIEVSILFLVFAFVVCLDVVVVFVCLFCDVFVCFSSSFYKIVYTLSLCDQGEKA